MTIILNGFVSDERGQDLIEYTLLIAFVVVASAAIFASMGGGISGIVGTTTTELTTAKTFAS